MERYLINTANLSSGGALQIALSLLRNFGKEDARFDVLLSPQLTELLKKENLPANVILHPLKRNPAASLGAWWNYLKTARALEAATRPDAVLTIFGPALWRPAAPHFMGFANGLYLFNESDFVSGYYLKSLRRAIPYRLKRMLMLNRTRHDADAWWVETADAAASLAGVLGVEAKAVQVIPNAVGEPFLQRLPPVSFSSGEKFRLLCIGAAHPNKNLRILSAVLELLPDANLEIQVTLSHAEFETLFPQHMADRRLRNLGVLHHDDAPAAYASAHALLLPTRLEIFSASYLEAMAAGLPILTSDLPFARSVCAGAALYFQPLDPADIAAAIVRLMQNSALREALVQEGFTVLKGYPTARDRAKRILSKLRALTKHGSGRP